MYKRVLAPLDGSKLSACSLDHITAISTGCNVTEVILLTVVEEPSTSYGIEYGSQHAIEEAVKQRQKEIKEAQKIAEDYLVSVAGSLKKEHIEVKTVVMPVAHGIAETILEYADNNQVDLIIMSTHGRSGISRFAFGSVTDKVVTSSKVPVLTISPPGCRLPVKL